METAWTIVGIVVPVLIGVGFSMIGLNPPEFKVARLCFWFSAILLGGMNSVWDIKTDLPAWWRILAGALIWILIGVGLPEGLRWVTRRERLSQSGTAVIKPTNHEIPTSDQKPSALSEPTARNQSILEQPPKHIPTSKPPTGNQPTVIIQTASTFGNLKERAITLSSEIMNDLYEHGWREDDPSRPPIRDIIQHIPKTPDARLQWYRSRSAYFSFRFLDKIRDISDEFAQLHLRNQKVDQFLERERSEGQLTNQKGAPFVDFNISAIEIEKVAEGLRELAGQIK